MRLLRKTCRIQDLVKRADLNGRMCTVDSFDEASARCAVSVSGGELQVWIKPENLLETLPDELIARTHLLGTCWEVVETVNVRKQPLPARERRSALGEKAIKR